MIMGVGGVWKDDIKLTSERIIMIKLSTYMYIILYSCRYLSERDDSFVNDRVSNFRVIR